MGNAAGKALAVSIGIMMMLSAFLVGSQQVSEGAQNELGVAPSFSSPISANYVTHAPIRINSNADFNAAHGVSNGSGTQGNPYIIENWDINGSGYRYCIYIGNTTSYFVVRNCNLHEASGVNSWPYYQLSGLALYNVQNGTIANNTASLNNWSGIFLHSSYNNTIANNSASSNIGGGIYLYSSYNITIENNNASSNSCGIALELFSNGNHIVANTISNNGDGIDSEYSDGNEILNNTISSVFHGIVFCRATDSIICQNTIVNNQIGIDYSDYARRNIIYHNNFINNTIQTYFDSGNQWDNGYPSGGNYWSDYNGTDVFSGVNQNQPGADGIGDTPYILQYCPDEDMYPLMVPWNGSSQSTSSSFFKIPVVVGWNLISVPLAINNSTVPMALIDSDSDTFWDRAMWFDAYDTANHWKQYNTNWVSSLNDLATVNHTMGVWINVTIVGDGYLNVTGSIVNYTSIPLHTGWNMVGYPTLNNTMTVADAFWGTGATMVKAFDASEIYKEKLVGPTYIMRPGEGYLVYVPADAVWSVDW